MNSTARVFLEAADELAIADAKNTYLDAENHLQELRCLARRNPQAGIDPHIETACTAVADARKHLRELSDQF